MARTKKKLKVYVARSIPERGIEILKDAGFDVKVYKKDQIIPPTVLKKEAKGADALLSILTDTIDDSVLSAIGPQLKIVANYAVGYNNIDVDACKKRGVIATNTPGVLSESVAEYTFTLILALSKRLIEADRFAHAGKYKGWSPTLLLGTVVKNKTLGIVGLGRIGRIVAQMAVRGMGMHVVYNDVQRHKDFENDFGAQYMDLDTLLEQSDYVTLHVPLLDSTRHLIGKKQFRKMKDSAFLINTSRGPVVEEAALIDALEKGQIAGAASDVMECEPYIGCNELARKRIKKLDNYIVTPHIASATDIARIAMAEIAANNIVAVLNGREPLTPVT